jgi:hypothetical protein
MIPHPRDFQVQKQQKLWPGKTKNYLICIWWSRHKKELKQYDGHSTSGWGSDNSKVIMSGAFDCKPTNWASGNSSQSLPRHKQSHCKSKGSVCPSRGFSGCRCLKQTSIRPALIQTSWPFLYPSTITAKTNTAIARCSGKASKLSRNLIKYACPPSLTKSTWHDCHLRRNDTG